MATGSFNLIRQHRGRGQYACVSVSTTHADVGPQITVGAHAFDWLREVYGANAMLIRLDAPPALAAIKGARHAVDHLPPEVDCSHLNVIIDIIRIYDVDTTEGQIAYAACLAVWDALNVRDAIAPAEWINDDRT